MENFVKKNYRVRSIQAIAIIRLTVPASKGQQVKPSHRVVSADLQPMPKSQLAIVPSRRHVSLMMDTRSLLDYQDFF